ncbi:MULTISPECIES: ABC transporter substrate-binding protein [Flavobacterium]|uniref:ABC transporter substrate-binding protein n=1 Tax=Flavobacterium jumunjinense TaxID=998845 RepID=A0ABV5GSX2_9FLAO|nr:MULTISPECIES: ABC transporter substrate-binding protein [Flavobacterium]
MQSTFKIVFLASFLFISCKKNTEVTPTKISTAENSIKHATGLDIFKYEDYSIVKVKTPWPEATAGYTYVLKKANAKLPDSLQKYTAITVPLINLVVTSTTIIPFLEMLDSETKLMGFPHTDYISSPKTRTLIEKGRIRDVGQNENLNIELLFDMQPEAIVTFGVDNTNKMVDKLVANGLKVLFQADWMEQSPLGKAEWIKFYGALLGKEKEANTIYTKIEKDYTDALTLMHDVAPKQTVMYGSLYKDQWFVARGNSWIAQFLNDAKTNYLWSDIPGTGSQPLSFESVFDKAQHADIWITNGAIESLAQLTKENHHYKKFDAYQSKQIYTFESQKGATGGTIYYELAPSRPDLVLKDFIKIFHPDVLPNYTFTFAKKLD